MGACWDIVWVRKRSSVWVRIVLIIVPTLLCFITEVHAVAVCEPEVARIVSIQGTAELRRVNQTNWQTVVLNTRLCAGDMLRVRARSRAALRLKNESMLRLDQKTTITFPELEADKATSLLDLIKGVLHIITRTPKPFKVRTPFLNGAVDGTEFYVGMNEDSTTIVLYEGQITTRNGQGTVVLTGHEAVRAGRNQVPQRIAVVKPTDAVQWALYYPTILDYTFNRRNPSPAIQPALILARQGQINAALSKLDRVPKQDRTIDFYIYQASLLLSVGRVEEAHTSLALARQLAPSDSEVNTLQAIIAVVQNDKAQALKLAQQAVTLNDASPAAWLALSYAQQAHFDIEAALASVQKAVQIDKRNALVWARLAELFMSMSELDQALDAARKAVDLNPDLAKTQTVLGFAYLLRIDTDTAKDIFKQAIMLDQADPMPRLGMGLALIREGELEAGRVELEIAASLDPANSLIRSYLGKAYFEEKRYDLSSTQFDLAKQRDPNDPTPWFYDAIQKQTQNRPVEALKDIQRSIELNDNRAVYRSKLLLDQDQAGRGSSLARIYDNLGFEKRALMETAKSLSFDPANHSAHRFLSDAYVNTPRHEIARVSELLQAQLLQPINVNPVQPRLAVADLNIITNTGPAVAGFNEFAPLMERNRHQLVASGFGGNQGTVGNEVVLSKLYERTSISLGQFHYETHGFRANNDQNHDIFNAFIQHAVTPRLNIQVEGRIRSSKQGNLLLDFDRNPDDLALKNRIRRNINEKVARVGAHYRLDAHQGLIFSGQYVDQTFKNTLPQSKNRDTKEVAEDSGFQTEAQYQLHRDWFNVLTGFGYYRVNVDEHIKTRFIVTNQEDCCQINTFNRSRKNGYLYTNLNFNTNLNMTLGFSYDVYKERGLTIDRLNPKFGLQWNMVQNLRLRFAWIEGIKVPLSANQTIEPTQVAGFNQLFDDPNGTKFRRIGGGLDAHYRNVVFGGLEVSDRDLNVPNFSLGQTIDSEYQKERLYRAYLYGLIYKHWVIRSDAQFEQFSRAETIFGPHQIDTLSVPVSVRYFSPRGFFFDLTGTYVRQKVERRSNENEGIENFVLFDAAVGYRFPNRRGILNLEVRNILDQSFLFRNNNFLTSEPINSRFLPERTIFARFTLNF